MDARSLNSSKPGKLTPTVLSPRGLGIMEKKMETTIMGLYIIGVILGLYLGNI